MIREPKVPHKKMLVVEDDANDAALMRRAFDKAHLEDAFFILKTADEAINYLNGTGRFADRARHPLPSMILLDLKLPGKSGFELLVWLRQQEGLRRLPVVVLSASGEKADINRAFDLGANSYLIKTADPDAYLDLINLYWTTMNQSPNVSSPR